MNTSKLVIETYMIILMDIAVIGCANQNDDPKISAEKNIIRQELSDTVVTENQIPPATDPNVRKLYHYMATVPVTKNDIHAANMMPAPYALPSIQQSVMPYMTYDLAYANIAAANEYDEQLLNLQRKNSSKPSMQASMGMGF